MTHYEHFVRQRITELRLAADISEHRLSLDLGKSGSYIRGITNGSAMPSFREFFNLCDYFNISPVDFFAPLADQLTRYNQICARLRDFDEADLNKVDLFTSWIQN